MKAMSPLTPFTLTPHSALVIASELGLAGSLDRRDDGLDAVPAAEAFGQAADIVASCAFHLAMNALATSGFFTASGNQGVKNTRW